MCWPVAGTSSVNLVSAATLRIVPTRKSPKKSSASVSVELIEWRIYLIRGHKVMIDTDLAELYEVPTKRFNEQVRRNLKRFPEDFMFQLTKDEGARIQLGSAISAEPRAVASGCKHSMLNPSRTLLFHG